nr:MAG TPA: hypothetical protein [Caudoviricetes sp.]
MKEEKDLRNYDSQLALLSEQTKQRLLSVLNQSGLPISLAYYILKDLYGAAEKTYFAAVNQASLNNIEEEVTTLNDSPTERED